MKPLIVLSALVFSVSASALESHYGEVSFKNGNYVCSYTNLGQPKNFKWVVFDMERRVGKERDVKVQVLVNKTVASGETIVADSNVTRVLIGRMCKFLAR